MKHSPSLLGVLGFQILSLSLAQAEEPTNFRARVYRQAPILTEADVKAEIEFGSSLAARILGRYQAIPSASLQQYIGLLGNGMAAQVGRPQLQYYFTILATDEINAYACPGGYIFITQGALKHMTNEAQLVGVLAHELAHVDRQHVVKKLQIKGKDESFAASFSKIVGGGTEVVKAAFDQMLDKAMQLLFEEGVDQADELEADTDALRVLATLGYDVKSYRNYLEQLQTVVPAEIQIIAKTHPPLVDRIRRLDTLMQQENLVGLAGKTNSKRFNETVHF